MTAFKRGVEALRRAHRELVHVDLLAYAREIEQQSGGGPVGVAVNGDGVFVMAAEDKADDTEYLRAEVGDSKTAPKPVWRRVLGGK